MKRIDCWYLSLSLQLFKFKSCTMLFELRIKIDNSRNPLISRALTLSIELFDYLDCGALSNCCTQSNVSKMKDCIR